MPRLFRWVTFALAVSAATFILAMAIGSWRWRARTADLLRRLESTRASQPAAQAGGTDLGALPAPVRRYLETARGDGASTITAMTIEHSGEFNMGESNDQWRSFTSRQRVVMRRPGFVWDGNIAMMRSLHALVHDAHLGGEGMLRATLGGLIPLASEQDREGDLARGELMRFLAEAPWYPTLLRPGQGVQWSAIDERSARASLSDGHVTVDLTFSFGPDGLVDAVRAEARGRTVGGRVVQTPWEGRWFDYERRDGMLVPTRGEVAWLLPDGPKPYRRGTVTFVEYERAP